jgi:YD repeat-containing protein
VSEPGHFLDPARTREKAGLAGPVRSVAHRSSFGGATAAAGPAERWLSVSEYGHEGQLLRTAHADRSATYVYAGGRLVEERHEGGGLPGWRVAYDYDPGGRLVRRRAGPAGAMADVELVRYAPSGAARLIALLRPPAEGLVGVRVAGARQSYTIRDVRETWTDFDPDGTAAASVLITGGGAVYAVTTVRTEAGSEESVAQLGPGALDPAPPIGALPRASASVTPAWRTRYEFGPKERVEREIREGFGAVLSEVRTSYDSRGQPSEQLDLSAEGEVRSRVRREHRYDLHGNWVERRVFSGPGTAAQRLVALDLREVEYFE